MVDLRTYITLEETLTKRLLKDWRKTAEPILADIARLCASHQWDNARELVKELDATEVGTQNREWIKYLLRACAVFGASLVAQRKPTALSTGSFDQTLNNVTTSFLMALELDMTAQVQEDTLQLIAEDQAKSTAQKFNPYHDDKGLFTSEQAAGEVTFYHGTSEAAWKDIQKEGLQPEKGIGADAYAAGLGKPFTTSIGGRKTSVFFTSNLKHAEEYASAAGAATHTKPLILKIEVPWDKVTQARFLTEDEKSEGEDDFRHIGTIPPEWIHLYPVHFTPKPPKIGYVGKADAPTVIYAVILVDDGEVAKWDESQHPREPKGQPEGGEFTDEPSVTLYRGDSENLSPSLSYSDPAALFGAGIYLTDNKRIAGDYKSKGGTEGELFRYGGGPKSTKQQALDAYIRSQATLVDATGKSLPYPIALHGYSGTFDSPGLNKKAEEDRLRQEHAQKNWDAIKDTVEIRKLADNTIVFTKKGQTGHLSEYAIPKSWVTKTLDAEAEIPKDVAAALSDAVRQPGYGNGPSQELYRKATTPNEEGFLPTFREVYREASSGWSGFGLPTEESQLTFRRRLKELGYKGISYAGGITMGGAKHTAYVFWDEQGLKKVRRKFDPSEPRDDQGRWTQTGTSAFKTWFGDSKVVDEQGKPLVVYHATKANFDVLGDVNTPFGVRRYKADATGRYVTPHVTFDNTGDSYLQLVASLNTSRLSTWGFTAEADVRGVTEYRLTAVLDGRTSLFCRAIDGKRFKVSDARAKIIQVLNATNPNDLKILQPWPKQTKAAVAEYARMSPEELTALGLNIPPFHPWCRTMCQIIGHVGAVVAPLESEDSAHEPVTQDTMKEVKVQATPQQVEHWNAFIKESPLEILSELSGLPPEEILAGALGPDSIQFLKNGDISLLVRGVLAGDVTFAAGALLDPTSGYYSLTEADLYTGTSSDQTLFIKRLLSGLVQSGINMAGARTLVVQAEMGEVLTYVKLGFVIPAEAWDKYRNHVFTEITSGSLVNFWLSLDPEARVLIQAILDSADESGASVLADLNIDVDGRSVGDWLLHDFSGPVGLALDDQDSIAQALAYLS